MILPVLNTRHLYGNMADMTGYLQGEVTLLGHRLPLLTHLVPPINNTPERMAQINHEIFTERRGDISTATVNWQALSESADDLEYEATYAYDLVGETPAQADTYKSIFRDVLATFVALDEDARILLTSKGLDGICNACTFKRHCQMRDEELDAQYLDLFEDMLAFARAKDRSLYVSAIRTPERNILTTAEAVRRVMGFFAMDGPAGVDDFYRDALHRQKLHGSMFAGPGKAAVVEYYDIREDGLSE